MESRFLSSDRNPRDHPRGALAWADLIGDKALRERMCPGSQAARFPAGTGNDGMERHAASRTRVILLSSGEKRVVT